MAIMELFKNVLDTTDEQAVPTETKEYFCDDSLFEPCVVCTENKNEEGNALELKNAHIVATFSL